VELSAFLADTYARNGLKTAYQRNHIKTGDELLIRAPIVFGKEQPAPAPRLEPAPVPTARTTEHPVVAHAKEAPAKTSAAQRYGPACSVGEVNQIGAWVSQNEVGGEKSFTAFNPNDHGHGISVGIMQWNQQKGKLPELLKAWYQQDPHRFNQIFGANAGNALNEKWVRSAPFAADKTLHQEMEDALKEPEFQQVQTRLRSQQIEKGCEIAKANHFTALRGQAVIADLVNRAGPTGAARVAASVKQGPPESQRIEILKKQIEKRIPQRSISHERVSSIEDRVREIWHQLAQSHQDKH
jgi:hypothetical protein